MRRFSGISAYLILDFPFTNTTGGSRSASFYSGSLSPGSDAVVDFLMNIDIKAKPDEYKINLIFDYLEQATGVGKTLYFLKSCSTIAPIVVTPPQDNLVIYDVVLTPLSTVPGGNITVAEPC